MLKKTRLETFGEPFVLALGIALLGISSCTNSSAFAQEAEEKTGPVIKKCTHQAVLKTKWAHTNQYERKE